ncbi:MAG TPA: c-type cytochrome [Burkholderiales bacterium]|nr:c-type cytochrome [Burkholderiales bacterium]
MSHRIQVAVLAALLGAAGTAYAQDQKSASSTAGASAKSVNVAMCAGCHGIVGYKTAFPTVYHVPKIGGQQRAYLEAALKAYRSGERSHPSMRGVAGSLTDEEIAALAAYYAGDAK